MKKVINFTPTGTQTTRENSFAPLTATEIIEETVQAYELGITLVHIHARDSNTLTNSWRPEDYQPIIEGIRKHCPDLAICASLTGRYFPEFEKRSAVLELKPDMGSLTMSSLNFPSGASINSPDMILKLIEKMGAYGVVPELECFDTGMINYSTYLIHKQILKPPYYFNMIFGNLFNMQLNKSSVEAVMNSVPENSIMCYGGIGAVQLSSNVHGLTHANGVRIGLEDNLYNLNREKVTNMQLLERIHIHMKEFKFEMMPPKEFKELGFCNTKL